MYAELLMSDEGSADSCRLLKWAGLPESEASNTRLALTMRSGAPSSSTAAL